jgi:hypothetical protein
MLVLVCGLWMHACASVGSHVIEAQYPNPPVPEFWKSSLEDVEKALASVRHGAVETIATSAGEHPVYVVRYGEKQNLESQANYNSAAAARDPQFYAKKGSDIRPVVYFVGPPHGQEPEGLVGLLNFLHIAETGKDYRGRAWPRLQALISSCRVLVIPLANPDGRLRCPYDSFVGLPVAEMTRVGQGTRKDGSLYGWPGAKQLHPMVGDVDVLGAYFNDDGINLMHDEFFDPMAEETRAVLSIAREEAPDYIINLHSHGQKPVVLTTAYIPWYQRDIIYELASVLQARYEKEGLPAGTPPKPKPDGAAYPPPSFNLTSALHHICGGVSMTFECPHGVKEEIYPQVSHSQILDIQLLLYEELLAYAVAHPHPGL